MYDTQEKTSKFLEAINKAAKEHCLAMEEEVKVYSKAEMEKAENLIHDECHRHLDKNIAHIKAETESKLAKYENDNKEQIIAKRQKIEDKVFDEAYESILNFSQRDEYKNVLLSSVKNASKYFDCNDCVILVRESDLVFENELKTAFGKECQVKADDEIILGGAKVQSNKTKIVVNDTFESRLQAQKIWFEENSDLKIV